MNAIKQRAGLQAGKTHTAKAQQRYEALTDMLPTKAEVARVFYRVGYRVGLKAKRKADKNVL